MGWIEYNNGDYDYNKYQKKFEERRKEVIASFKNQDRMKMYSYITSLELEKERISAENISLSIRLTEKSNMKCIQKNTNCLWLSMRNNCIYGLVECPKDCPLYKPYLTPDK